MAAFVAASAVGRGIPRWRSRSGMRRAASLVSVAAAHRAECNRGHRRQQRFVKLTATERRRVPGQRRGVQAPPRPGRKPNAVHRPEKDHFACFGQLPVRPEGGSPDHLPDFAGTPTGVPPSHDLLRARTATIAPMNNAGSRTSGCGWCPYGPIRPGRCRGGVLIIDQFEQVFTLKSARRRRPGRIRYLRYVARKTLLLHGIKEWPKKSPQNLHTSWRTSSSEVQRALVASLSRASKV
jgi:hypothetical protein